MKCHFQKSSLEPEDGIKFKKNEMRKITAVKFTKSVLDELEKKLDDI